MTTLRDPNICHCFGYTTSTRGYAFVMEVRVFKSVIARDPLVLQFCELGDLRGILDSGSDLTMPIRFKVPFLVLLLRSQPSCLLCCRWLSGLRRASSTCTTRTSYTRLSQLADPRSSS